MNNYPTVSTFSNISWILDSQNALVSSDINAAAMKGQKSIIDLSFVFFMRDPDTNALVPNNSAQANWTALATLIASQKSDIAAFYPIDEPNGNNISAAYIQWINTTIRASFPGTPIAVIYSEGADPSSIQYYDWVGFDCYSNGQFMCGTTNYTSSYATLKSYLTSSQRIILVPQVGVSGGTSVTAALVNNLTWESLRLYELAYGDPQIIGMFGFVYQSQAGWTGLVGLPTSLQATVTNVGQTVMRNWTYPAGIVPVYRFTKTNATTDHLFTLTEQEGIGAAIAGQYSYEGFGFSVYTTELAGTHPLYRCQSGTASHFISEQINCEGYTLQSLLGYVSTSQTSTTVPLYRFFNSHNGSHLETIDYAEGTGAGLTYEGILGYSPSVQF